jgi:hypothetical protein
MGGHDAGEEVGVKRRARGFSLTNEQLAHEIILNSDFKFEDRRTTEKGMCFEFRELFTTVFWDSLLVSISANPPVYLGVLPVFEEIKAGG